MSKITAVPVRDLQEGDQLLHHGQVAWTARYDARFAGRKVTVQVQRRDGKFGTERWDDPEHVVTIQRGAAPTPAPCPECGESPMGTGCYRICPNSVHFYSPEQERADEPFYGLDDHRERYAAEAQDMALESQRDAEWADEFDGGAA
jgi:hypothetical protein